MSDPSHVRLGKTVRGKERIDTDVVIIGSGAGGATAALELASAGYGVVVLEAGPYVKPEEFTQREVDTMKRIYVDQGGQGPADGSISVLQGRVVGGSTVINGEVCFRIPEHVLDEWAKEFGVRGLSSAELRCAFEDVERGIHATTNEGKFLSSGQRLEGGMRKLGIVPKPLVRNVKGCRGCAYCFIGCAYGCKQSMDQSYLPAAMAKGATVISDARVERIEFDRLGAGARARGVVARTPEGTLEVRARVVIVACGAIETPLMLLDHKLGGPEVGKHLALHPVVVGSGWFDDEELAYRSNMLATYTDVWLEDGILIETATASPPFLASGLSGFGREHKELARDLRHASGGGAIVRDDGSLGRVRRGRGGEKIVEWKLDARTTQRVRDAMKHLAEIAFAAGARKVSFPTTIPNMIESVDDLRKIDTMPCGPADVTFLSYHPQGTARLGVVTDMDGAVKGARDLYVMDASLFPSPVGVNTQVPVMGVVTVLARRLASRLRARA
jgi:choline dehydrogenase-like flavoprotein